MYASDQDWCGEPLGHLSSFDILVWSSSFLHTFISVLWHSFEVFLSFSLCQRSRLRPSQLKEKSHGWVCLAFLVCSSSLLFCMMHSELPAIIFLNPFFFFFKCPFSVVHQPFYPLSSSPPTLSFILSLICHGPPSTLPIGPHLPIPQQPLTTVCVTGALNLNQCAQVKHILHTCFSQTHTQYSYIVTAVYMRLPVNSACISWVRQGACRLMVIVTAYPRCCAFAGYATTASECVCVKVI